VPHVHINLRDAQGAPTVPSVKPPRAKPPKAPGAKPPAAPKAKLPNIGRAATEGVKAGTGLINRGTGLVRRAESGVNRLSEFGGEFNRDASGRDEMGHYHFNIPFRGSRARDSNGAMMASEVPGKTNMKKKKTGETIYPRDAGTSEGAKKAAQTRARGGASPYNMHSEKTPYWRGGELDIKAGSQTKQAAPKRDPEPFRGYDKSPWW